MEAIPVDCDGACQASDEICMSGQSPHCVVGFSPTIIGRTPGGNIDYTCLPPADEGNPFSGGCAYACQRSGDCPFAGYDCIYGRCSSAETYNNPCDGTCAPDESCAITSHDAFYSSAVGFCVAADSCVDDLDCVSPAICKSVCTAPCTINSDCATGECVGELQAIMGERHCLPSQCGCTGSQAGDAFCDFHTNTCTIVGLCNNIPCDGSVDPQCTPTEPSPAPTDCACPSCAWNQGACAGAEGSQFCPSGFTCTGLGDIALALPPTVGTACSCDATECQTP